MLTPDASAEKFACHFTFWIPPGSPPAGTTNCMASSKVFPANPLDGTVICHRFFAESKLMVAPVALGLNVMFESGTGML